MNFVSEASGCCECCSPHSAPSFHPFIPQQFGVVRSINCRATAYHLGLPIACQSSDKMDFQLSQGSQAGFCKMGSRLTSSAPLTSRWLFVFLFLSPSVICFSPSSFSLKFYHSVLLIYWPEPREMKIGLL